MLLLASYGLRGSPSRVDTQCQGRYPASAHFRLRMGLKPTSVQQGSVKVNVDLCHFCLKSFCLFTFTVDLCRFGEGQWWVLPIGPLHLNPHCLVYRHAVSSPWTCFWADGWRGQRQGLFTVFWLLFFGFSNNTSYLWYSSCYVYGLPLRGDGSRVLRKT